MAPRYVSGLGRFYVQTCTRDGQPILTELWRRSAATTASSTCSTAPPVGRGYGRWPAFADGPGELFQFRHEHGGDVVDSRARPDHGGVGISCYGLAFRLDLEAGGVRAAEGHPPGPAINLNAVKEVRRSLGYQALSFCARGKHDLERRGPIEPSTRHTTDLT